MVRELPNPNPHIPDSSPATALLHRVPGISGDGRGLLLILCTVVVSVSVLTMVILACGDRGSRRESSSVGSRPSRRGSSRGPFQGAGPAACGGAGCGTAGGGGGCGGSSGGGGGGA